MHDTFYKKLHIRIYKLRVQYINPDDRQQWYKFTMLMCERLEAGNYCWNITAFIM